MLLVVTQDESYGITFFFFRFEGMMPGIAEKLTHSHQLEFWEYQKVNEVVIKSEKEKLEASRSSKTKGV